MSLCRTIFHITKNNEYKPVAALSDEEFEDFLNDNGFEVVSSEGGWTIEARENMLKSMVKILNELNDSILNQITPSE